MTNGYFRHNRNIGSSDSRFDRAGVCSYVIKFITKDLKADVKNLYDITVKLIDSNRESKDESKKTLTAVQIIKDIVIQLFRGKGK
jgi:hypothetical protein